MAAVFLGSAGLFQADAQVGRLAGKTGTVVTPRNFPKHTADDLTQMFRLDGEIGSFAVMRVNWNDANRFEVARILTRMAEQHGLEPVVEFSPFKADGLRGASLDPGKSVPGAGRRLSFANPIVADAFSAAILEIAALSPSHLAVATDVNLYALTDPEGFRAFVRLYADLYSRIKQTAPNTKVFVTFQWDALQALSVASTREMVSAFGGRLDLFALTSEPRRLFERSGPSSVDGDYYSRIGAFAAGRPVFLEVNWPSEGRNGEADQVAFVRSLPRLLRRLDPSMVAWTFLHDVRVLFFTLKAGLLNADGSRKPAFEAFKEISGDRSGLAREDVAPRGGGSKSRSTLVSKGPDHFGIYTARLDGSDVQAIMTSPDHEMTHPRVSPDGRRIVLTRYNNRGKDGKATEEQGYDNTEILIVNLDGTGLETIVPARPGVMAANGCWSPDGKSLIYISTDNQQRRPEIRRIDLDSRKITRLPTPPGLPVTDPHWEGNEIVFPVKGEGSDALWTMKVDGSDARQITRPNRTRQRGSMENYGDFDPKFSPDGSKIAFMRIFGGESWKVMVLDRRTGEERNLTTEEGVIEGLPTWSSDGRLLLYRHIDRKRPREIGLWTMTPSGADRKIVPLPRGYLYNHGTFFPSDGSSPRARIIYTGTRAPGL